MLVYDPFLISFHQASFNVMRAPLNRLFEFFVLRSLMTSYPGVTQVSMKFSPLNCHTLASRRIELFYAFPQSPCTTELGNLYFLRLSARLITGY